MTASGLEITDLSKNFGSFKLRDVNLSTSQSDYLVILGPSGCGKTSLLECIVGIQDLDQGRITVNGTDITHRPVEKRNIGFVYQSLMLFPHMTVYQNVAYGLQFRDVSDKKRRVMETLEALKIAELSERHTAVLSGGEKQRVALARALVIRPEILLLDEPLSSLDSLNKKMSIELLKTIKDEFHPTTIHVTHDHAEAISLATKIGIMNEGRLVHIAPAKEFFQKPSSRFIADFICAENVFEGVANMQDGNCLVHLGQNGKSVQVWSAEEKQGKVNLLIHPTNIVVSKEKISSSMRNVLRGNVTSIVDSHHLIKITVDTGVPFTINLTRQSFEEMQIMLGASLYIAFKASATHLF